MLHHIPRTLPSLGDMLADLGRPHPYSLGQALGVDERTARRWIKQGHAPRAAMLALFWVTSWGSSALDAGAHNRAMAWRGLAQAQGRELARVQARADAMARALMASGWSGDQVGWAISRTAVDGPVSVPQSTTTCTKRPPMSTDRTGEPPLTG